MGGSTLPLFLGLRSCVVNSLVLVLRASRRHQKLAVLFSYNGVVSDLQGTLRINELSMGSVQPGQDPADGWLGPS